MRYLALATDYDGTLATEGKVYETTLDALKRWRESGRKLFLVTGRHFNDLCRVFPQVDWFDCIVAENGALLHFPATQEEQLIGDRPPEAFLQALRNQQVAPLDVGKVIVSTWEPHDITVLETIRKMGLAWQVILNKGAVMVLPAGVNKATGLSAALQKWNLSPEQTIAVGDAENDYAFMELCGLAVAVANALPTVQEQANWVTQGSRGEGVVELIDRYLTIDV
jgi:hydroxymethylpyrimidine pyrophosphatase-like HAD family hydrolase